MSDARPTVLITDPEFTKGEAAYAGAADLECVRAPDTEDELASTIRDRDARFVIVGNKKYSGPLYDALPPASVIARMGVGHDGIDKARATAARLICTNTPGVLDQSVAEHAMLLIAAAARRFLPALTSMSSGVWIAPPGRDLYGKRLAIIGCGGIGRALARIASAGYGMEVVGNTRRNVPAPASIEHFQTVTNDFAAAVHGADFVSLHMPATAENHGFVNRERLGQMDRGAWLINTARGAVVEEAALFECLTTGGIAGAALDVFAQEPYVPSPGSGDLRSLSNVILTPHVGSNTVESNRRMAERALMNVRFAHAGQFDRMDVVNK